MSSGNSQIGNGTAYTPSATDMPDPIRAGVVFYSVGKGDKASDIIYSWK